jgi:hypothetical protein
MRTLLPRIGGFSFVELTIATALTLALVASIVELTQASRAASATQAEAADLRQRVRVGVDTLTRDIMAAGAGTYAGDRPGPLNAAVPAVFPYRYAVADADPPGTFRSDAITLITVPTTAAQTTLIGDLAPGSVTMQVARVPICAPGINLCSFAEGTTLLTFDDSGASRVFTVAAVLDGPSELQTTAPASSLIKAGSPVAAVEVHVYSLKTDPATHGAQLVHGTPTASSDLPVLDHVAALSFDYGVAPVELADGPWRPDAASAERWDVDLLRIRTVGVTVRFESAMAALRGPAGALFAHAGTATNPRIWVPDQEVRFAVSPRNLSLRR